MKLESVRSFKQEVSAETREAAEDTPAAQSFFDATEPPMPDGVALGVALRENGEHVVAIRSDDPEKAAAIAARVHGEADVQILTVSKRPTPTFLQGTVRPLEAGVQIGMSGMNFVGTLGCFVRDAAGTLYALSNSHVIANEGRVGAGWAIGQPFGSKPIGVLARFIPFSLAAPNLVDAAIMRVDKTSTLPRWNAAIAADLIGSRPVTPDDLNRPVWKVGRTTGARRGTIRAVEVDGLPVAYDSGTLRFSDQVEISGGVATDFSAGGDSGSLIVDEAGWGIGLLFAGGRDSTGQDNTYANRLTVVLDALGVTLAL